MSGFTTLNQLIEFVEKRILLEEADPIKARKDQVIIKDMINTSIHGGKDPIAPTEEQWKNILQYYKNKIKMYQSEPIKNNTKETDSGRNENGHKTIRVVKRTEGESGRTRPELHYGT